jgi:hypothetical protein
MSSSYEVYLDVRHHPRYNEDWEKKESTAFKLVDTGDPLAMVADALRSFADDIDPRFICSHCGKERREHFSAGRLFYCFNKYGPITQHAWWSPPPEQ